MSWLSGPIEILKSLFILFIPIGFVSFIDVVPIELFFIISYSKILCKKRTQAPRKKVFDSCDKDTYKSEFVRIVLRDQILRCLINKGNLVTDQQILLFKRLSESVFFGGKNQSHLKVINH